MYGEFFLTSPPAELKVSLSVEYQFMPTARSCPTRGPKRKKYINNNESTPPPKKIHTMGNFFV